MPIPMAIQHATEDFERFLAQACDISGLTTRHQTYTMVEGVLRAFRARLTVRDALRFANVLPPVLRAIFVADWDTDAAPLPFADRSTMTRDAQALRIHHNFAPDTCIADVARALRRTMDEAALDAVLDTLPDEARAFWRVSPADA